MHNFIRILTLVAAFGMAAPMTAATQNEFYASVLRRGVASYEANRYPDAAKQLRIAAFGLVDTIDQYQLAQMYLAITHDKLGEADRAREAARRVVIAERVERKYKSVQAPAAVRSAFETLAGRLLTPAEVAILRGGPIAVATPPARPFAKPPTTTTPPRAPATDPKPDPPQTSASAPSTASTTTPPRATPPASQSASPENIAPQTNAPVPQPQKPKPESPAAKPIKPPATATTPAKTTQRPATPATTKTSSADANGRGGPVEAARPSVPAPTPRTLSATEVATRLTAAEGALNSANLSEARRLFVELLSASGLDHVAWIRVAEGLYRARSFAAALTAFNRMGALRRGEEPYRYYIAVAAYETGDFARAKKELAAALPYIEVTADVARYRTRIDGSP